MKSLKNITGALVFSGILAWSGVAIGADHKGHTEAKKEKLKPYQLKTCLVSGEKLGSMGEPYVHKYKDREIKFCCKGCVKDFNKEPEKYVKKLEAAEKNAKKGKTGVSEHGHESHDGHRH